MTAVRTLGLVLVIAGLIAVLTHVFPGGGGPAGAEERQHVARTYPLAPVLGGIALVTGALLLTVFGPRGR